LKKLKLWARITEIMVLLAGLAVLFCVLALDDIFAGDTYPEWTIVRISFVVIVLCLISTFITLYHLFRYLESRDEEKADFKKAVIRPAAESAETKAMKESGPQNPPAARRIRTRRLPGKRPSPSAAQRQRQRKRTR